MNIYLRMIDTIREGLHASGMDETAAIESSVRMVSRISSDLGGNYCYIPKGNVFQSRELRNIKIAQEFDGRNLDQIKKKYKVSRATIYRICKK